MSIKDGAYAWNDGRPLLELPARLATYNDGANVEERSPIAAFLMYLNIPLSQGNMLKTRQTTKTFLQIASLGHGMGRLLREQAEGF